MKRLPVAAILSATTGLLACGCLWGHVYDAETGLDVPGANVSWVGGNGSSNSETTGLFWAPGLYVFCGSEAPLSSPVTFTVSAPGYLPLTAERQILWDDGPGLDSPTDWPTCDNLWEIQDFYLMPLPGTSALPPQPSPSPAATETPMPTPTPKPGLIPLPRRWPTATPMPPPR
jgi:hypothetical protein